MIQEKLDNNNLEIYIPIKITKYCTTTAYLFLILGIICLVKKINIFGCLLILLYITTTLHWNCLYIKSIYRTIDMFVVMLTFFYSFIFVFNFDIKYLMIGLFCSVVYYLNELIYFYSIELPKKNNYYYKTVPEIGSLMTKYPLKWNFSNFNNSIKISYLTFYIINFFNIKPTYNNTKERMYAYHKYVLIHAIFIHFFYFLFLIYKILLI